MVTSSWVTVLPAGFTPEKYDGWYLYTHTDVAKLCEDLVHYSVNRCFAEQPRQSHRPEATHGEIFRIAQLWWETPEKVQSSFNSYSGSAVRGDALLNVSLDLSVHPSMALTEDTQFDVAKPAVFDMFRRGYRGTPDGTIVKVLAFGLCEDRSIGSWYSSSFSDLGRDERLRNHFFGASINRRLPIGLDALLPGDGQIYWDWMVELWFDSKADAASFMDSQPFTSMWAELAGRSGDTLLSVLRCQEMMVAIDPIDHVDE